MGIHDGHRARLRASFLEHGLQSMNDINALELLLFYALPRRDTNETAHLLLERFGSLDGVFSAPIEELCEVEGVGEYVASLITLIPEIMKKARLSKVREIKQIKCSEDAGEYLLPYFMNEQDEVVYMLCLDAKRVVICCTEMGRAWSTPWMPTFAAWRRRPSRSRPAPSSSPTTTRTVSPSLPGRMTFLPNACMTHWKRSVFAWRIISSSPMRIIFLLRIPA